jgi:hypothetical protein
LLSAHSLRQETSSEVEAERFAFGQLYRIPSEDVKLDVVSDPVLTDKMWTHPFSNHAGATGWDDHKEAYGYGIVLGMVSGSSLYGLAAMSVDHSHYFGVSSEMMQPESLWDQRVDPPMPRSSMARA